MDDVLLWLFFIFCFLGFSLLMPTDVLTDLIGCLMIPVGLSLAIVFLVVNCG